ncbi:MAG: NAD-dependent epimerase/dehydratase family protein [Bacteroidota bacterium]|nr:NAD-dependent epimerase/dehydratase family protein [Bacteroidota bacterium]
MTTKITNSTILVTGGAGFIGSYVIELLVAHNPKKIIIIDNLIRGSHENMKNFKDNPAVEFHEGDIRDMELMDKLMTGVDYVYHMAALRINACAANPQDGFGVMVQATFNIANLCVKHKVKKVIYSSTASVYGLAQNFPTPETDNPYNNQTFYGGAKVWGEQLFRSYKFMYNLDYVALRYFNVYGSRMDTDGKYTEVMIKWLDCVRDKKQPAIFGDGTDSMDFVHVKDIAKANELALLAEVTDETFNVGDQVETNLKQMLDALLKVNDANLEPVFKEANSVNPVSRRLADISKAKNLLGYTPSISLEQGLKELSNWYFEKQKIKH